MKTCNSYFYSGSTGIESIRFILLAFRGISSSSPRPDLTKDRRLRPLYERIDESLLYLYSLLILLLVFWPATSRIYYIQRRTFVIISSRIRTASGSLIWDLERWCEVSDRDWLEWLRSCTTNPVLAGVRNLRESDANRSCFVRSCFVSSV